MNLLLKKLSLDGLGSRAALFCLSGIAYELSDKQEKVSLMVLKQAEHLFKDWID